MPTAFQFHLILCLHCYALPTKPRDIVYQDLVFKYYEKISLINDFENVAVCASKHMSV